MVQRSLDGFPTHQVRIIGEVNEDVDRGEVLRYLGYPIGAAPNGPVQECLEHWIETAGEVAVPRAIYVVLPIVDKGQRHLRLQAEDGTVEFRGAIGEFLGVSHHIAAFIATAGPELEALATELMDKGDELSAMIVNSVGAERAEAAENVVIDELREQAAQNGDAPTLPYSPGYCGMSLKEQPKLFGLFDKENVGVTLTSSCLMRPLKSVSGLIGIGSAEDVTEFGTPCERCELKSCAMRR